MRVRLPYNWQPRDYQLEAWQYLEHGGLRANMAWHRRSGKDDLALHWTAVAAHKRIGNYWHMLPEANQARKAIWDAINAKTGKRRIDEAFPQELRSSTRDDIMLIRFKCGSSWQVVGSDNYDSLVGASPIGIVFSEWALSIPISWAYLRPILLENGGWAMFIWTPRGRNHAVDMFMAHKDDPEWFTQRLAVQDTQIFTPKQLEGELKEYIVEFGQEAGRAKYEQEYECNFDSAILGAVYGKWITNAEKAKRICKVMPAPGIKVNTSWDLGYDDATAIWWWQVLRGEIRVLDYFEANLEDVPYYCDIITGRIDRDGKRLPDHVKVHGRISKDGKPYDYGRHYVPHDATNQLLAAGGRSIIERAKSECGVQMLSIPATTMENSIGAARMTLERCWFDEEYTAAGLKALRHYHFPWDDETKKFAREPKHDWSSHAADAIEIMGRVWKNPPPELAPTEIIGIEKMTMKQAWDKAAPRRSDGRI